MLFAGMATRAFCAMATPNQEKLIEMKATRDSPCRKTSLRFIRIVWAAIFMPPSFWKSSYMAGKAGGV